MSEHDNNLPMEEEQSSYIPASFEKRVAAWVGVVYMIMLTLSVTFMIATGEVLQGTATLLLPPAAVGVAVVAIRRYRRGELKQGRTFLLALLFLCFMAVVLGLVTGVPVLLSQLGGGV